MVETMKKTQRRKRLRKAFPGNSNSLREQDRGGGQKRFKGVGEELIPQNFKIFQFYLLNWNMLMFLAFT